MAHPHQLVREAFPGLFPEMPPLPQPDPGPLGAFLAKLGLSQEDIRRIQADEVEVEITLKAVAKLLFDRNGRRIPRALSAAVCDANRSFHLVQPDLDYQARASRLASLGVDAQACAEVFESRSTELVAQLRGNEQLVNILSGVYLPILIPQTMVTDLGETTEKFVEAVERSYRNQYPDRPFTNYRKNELAKKVKVVEGSRYKQLLGMIAGSYAVALYFPTPLQGYSVHAQREQMATLPPGFILSGPIDTATAWVMYPDVLGRDYNTPVNDCSAVSWRGPSHSLCFEAREDNAVFGYRASLSKAIVNFSGGLLFVG